MRRAHHEVVHVAIERRLVAGEHRRVQRLGDLGHRRRRHRRHLRDGVRREGQIGELHVSRDPVGDHREHRRPEVLHVVVGAAHRRGDGGRLLAEAVDDGDDHAAELRGEPGVEGQFPGEPAAGLPGIVEVTADDHRGRGPPLHLVVALDDPRDQFLASAVGDQGAGLVVGGAEALVGADVDAVPVGEQGQDRVLPGGADQRPERADPLHLAGEELGQAESDGRLAAAGADTGEVDTASHALNLCDRELLVVLIVEPGQPGGEPLDRGLELRVQVDEVTQPLAEPLQASRSPRRAARPAPRCHGR